MEKVRIGIIGYGNMGTGHAKNLIDGQCPEIELCAIADKNPKKLEAAKAAMPENVKLFSDATEMLDSGLIDAVIVAVPHYDHPKYVMQALERKIHAMSEKPAGVYTKQVKEMNEAAKKSDAVFAMMFNQRTNPMYRKMKELIDSGKYGRIRRTNWIITDWYRNQAYYDSGDWRATWSGEGGGVLLNQCPHNLDLWQWICGMPKKITANMYFGKWHDIEVEDDVTAFVEYENGATGTFITTTGDVPGTNRFEITLDKAKIVAEGRTLKVTELAMSEPEFTKTSKTPFACPEMTTTEEVFEDGGLQHVGVLNAFAGKILHGTDLIANGEEGINGLTLSNAMHLSAFTGKTIELPMDEEKFYEELMARVKTSRRKENVNEVVSDLSNTYNN